ncbi:MAG TPA: CDP-alcohol phosphatidyltransferase family protein [Gaiellaceae bacterium]|nr:CDP-alcohol phosphatidyltransferase family protein [Gaiellaceae bacterium]
MRGPSLSSSNLARSRKSRRGTEFVCEWIFRPLAHPLVLAFARLRVPPPLVVAASGAAGVGAAFELGRGSLLAAAVIVQLKTLLDNADGQLARLTGRTSAFGRYLDSEVDLLVNAALFAALAWSTAQPALALAGFLALTSVLSLNFNVERLSRRGAAEPETEGGPTELLRRIYALVYAPQDRLAESVVARRPALVAPAAVSLLANLGMSTQLAVFGLLIAVGHPLVFPWLALAEVAVIAVVVLSRVPRRQEEIA